MDIRIIREPIELSVLEELARASHHTLVKGVVDVSREIIALGGEWHMDANVVLITDGSVQSDVWGFNIYPTLRGDEAIEYISLINIRPSQGNRSMDIADETRRSRIRQIVARLAPDLSL